MALRTGATARTIDAMTPHPFLPGSRDAVRRVRMVTFDRFEMLDVVGPLETFATAAAIAGGGYAVDVVAPGGGLVASSSGLRLATVALEAVPWPEAPAPETGEAAIDTVLVAGGAGVSAAREDAGLVAWIGRAAGSARRLGSVCTGAFLLARAGLLDGRDATTHWNWCDRLAAAHPAARVERDAIFVRDGAIWTSAGVTAGIDLALAMIEEDFGPELALATARELVVYLKRPGGQAQFSGELRAQATGDGPIRRVVAWIGAHPEGDLAVERLAERVGMSPRNFSRVFRAEVGRTPAAFVEEVRLARAARLLEGTDLAIEEVARRSGFRSGDVLRRVFLRTRHVTPGAHRARFATLRAPAPAADIPRAPMPAVETEVP